MSELLLIDDDRELCELLGTWLVQEGFSVRASHDGAQARRALAEQTPDAVVLDVMLPDGSGLELLKQLRGDHPDLPVLMLSARGEPLDRILGLELGADDYLAKPCDPRELTARLRAVLRRTHPAQPSAQMQLGDLSLNLTRGVAQIDGQEISLTLSESRILEALLRQPGEPLDKLYQRVKKGKQDPVIRTFAAGMEEWQNGVAMGMPGKESVAASLRQRVERAMSVAINREMNRLERGMTFLANVGSTAPFVGLFGTVWGIMHSFTAIASSQNTSLAVVAPGIAEALFATALGLVAAIPAVIAYNKFTNDLNRYADRLDAFMSEFSAILSRHLDSYENSRGGVGSHGKKSDSDTEVKVA